MQKVRIIKELQDIMHAEHMNGCRHRITVCSCGTERREIEAITKALDKIKKMQKALQSISYAEQATSRSLRDIASVALRDGPVKS
jgi:hypothetical protein